MNLYKSVKPTAYQHFETRRLVIYISEINHVINNRRNL
jgi:hypothetical protein